MNAQIDPARAQEQVGTPATAVDAVAGGDMHSQLTRHAVHVLAEAGLTQEAIAAHCKMSERTVRRILAEPRVETVDDQVERRRRGIGRPSSTDDFEAFVVETLSQDPELMTLELLRRARHRGYKGGKSAFYEMARRLRDEHPEWVMRFEGLAGEFSQHDFGQIDIKFIDRSRRRVKFFASRLKYSRYVLVTLVPDETAETLVRTLLEHFVGFGGVPLCAVFDRPKTVALKWTADGKVTEWNPTFAQAAMDVGFTAEVCWPRSPRQKGSVENLVGWVKGSFFKQRRFIDLDDVRQQLDEWHVEVNEERPSRATDIVPVVRLTEERQRLRAPRVSPDELALRIPISVGPTGYVVHDAHSYSMPPRAAGLPATLHLYRDRVRIVAGRFEATHPRVRGKAKPSTLPEHRAQQLSALSGTRGKRYLKRQHLFDLGEPAVVFLTELVHNNPKGWYQDVDLLHALLQRHGSDVVVRAMRAAADVDRFDAAYVEALVRPSQPSLFGGEAQA